MKIGDMVDAGALKRAKLPAKERKRLSDLGFPESSHYSYIETHKSHSTSSTKTASSTYSNAKNLSNLEPATANSIRSNFWAKMQPKLAAEVSGVEEVRPSKKPRVKKTKLEGEAAAPAAAAAATS